MIEKLLVILLLFTQLLGGQKMSIYNMKAKDIDGQVIKLDKYKGRVMLVVNVASKCGYTSQYEGLQRLHTKYSSKGLSILGFPCNQFLYQEPGTEEDIKNFCVSNFGVSFDMFSKINVNGRNAHPLFKYLKKNAGGFITNGIKWNFTKFLINREGVVLKRYAPSTRPDQMESDIKALL